MCVYVQACINEFAAVGLFSTVWNSLPDELRDPVRDFDSFRQFLTTVLFSFYRRDNKSCINAHFTYFNE